MSDRATLHRWAEIPGEQLNDRLTRRYVGGDHATIAQFHLAKGCFIPSHQHENEQFTSVLQGVLRFTLGAEQAVADVRAGEMLRIPGNLSHSAEALEDTVVLDVFCPPRADWMSKDDAYLRGSRESGTGNRAQR